MYNFQKTLFIKGVILGNRCFYKGKMKKSLKKNRVECAKKCQKHAFWRKKRKNRAADEKKRQKNCFGKKDVFSQNFVGNL